MTDSYYQLHDVIIIYYYDVLIEPNIVTVYCVKQQLSLVTRLGPPDAQLEHLNTKTFH